MPTDPGHLIVSTGYGAVLVGGAGADTFLANAGTDEMTGGGGADLFQFAAKPYNGAEITDFQPGLDRLDISKLFEGGYSGADPVADGYVKFESNGAGGTKVMLDADGPSGQAHSFFQLVAVLDNVSPVGLTAAQVFGAPEPVAGVTLTSSRYGDVLVGGPGNDTLVAGQGPDKLTGGAGADLFVYHAKPYNGGEITDFHPGVDKLDISALIQGGSQVADPVAGGYLRFDSDGAGNTKVMVDPTGSADPAHLFQLVTVLDGVSPQGLTAQSVLGAAAPGSAPAAALAIPLETLPLASSPVPASAAAAPMATSSSPAEPAGAVSTSTAATMAAPAFDHHVQHLAGMAHGGDFAGLHWDLA